jgi:serine/threonine protein kinase
MKKKAVQREIAVLKKTSHPNVIKLIELIETPKQINLVMEYVNGISLHQFVKELSPQRRVGELQCRKLFKQIAEGVEYLHSINVAHRDLKLDNILIEDGKSIKIIDFGFSVLSNPSQKLKIFCGTPSYMAPELTQKREYDGKAVDMWALGVLLFVLLAGSFPFRGHSESELYSRI